MDKQPKLVLLRAARNRVIILEDRFKYEGRIVIPDKAQRRPTTGEIVDVGKDVEDYKIGDKVLVAQFSGTGIKIRNHPEYRVCSPDEILCYIDPQAEIEEVSA